jgi:hypothetical protein
MEDICFRKKVFLGLGLLFYLICWTLVAAASEVPFAGQSVNSAPFQEEFVPDVADPVVPNALIQ